MNSVERAVVVLALISAACRDSAHGTASDTSDLPAADAPTKVAPVPPPDPSELLHRALGLQFRLGDSWLQTVPRLGAAHCLSEDSSAFDAMDCTAPLSLGPFGASAHPDGFTVFSYDQRTLARVFATQSARVDCGQFQTAMATALTSAGIRSEREALPEGLRLRAHGGAQDDLLLTVDCHPASQSIELAPAWLHFVPRATCAELAAIPDELRRSAQSALLAPGQPPVPNDLSCNPGRAEVLDYAGLMLSSAQSAYQAARVEVPAQPPDWVVARVRHGLEALRAAPLPDAVAQQVSDFIAIQSRAPFLTSVWKRILRAQQNAPARAPSAPPQSPPPKRSKKAF